LNQQIELNFPNDLHETYGWYEKNHGEKIKEIEEYLYMDKIRTKADFQPWLMNAKRSIITDNRNYRIANGIVLKKKGEH